MAGEHPWLLMVTKSQILLPLHGLFNFHKQGNAELEFKFSEVTVIFFLCKFIDFVNSNPWVKNLMGEADRQKAYSVIKG
jgi:hypothetical protein